MSCSYLTERKIPRSYWYCAISHSSIMLNLFPSKLSCWLMAPHELVYGAKTNTCSWLPIFSIGYFRHKKYGAVTRSTTQSQTLAGISIVQVMNSNSIQFYNPVAWRVYTNGDYKLGLWHHTNTHFGLAYDGGICVGIYSSYSDLAPKSHLPGTQVRYCPPKS